MRINISEHNRLAASMIIAHHFSKLTLNLVRSHSSSLHSTLAPFVCTIDHFIRTLKLNVMAHMTSFNAFNTSIFALDQSFWAVFDYMSIHFDQGKSDSTFQNTFLHSIDARLSKMRINFATHNQSACFIIRAKYELELTFINVPIQISLLANDLTQIIDAFDTKLINEPLNWNVPLNLIHLNVCLAKRTIHLPLDTFHTK